MNRAGIVAAVIALVILAFAAGYIDGMYTERQRNPINKIENLLK